ncbi:MAG: YhjD/YihY/BrkB family envelope integrity protein [Metamycoplasmataceae bacterium]
MWKKNKLKSGWESLEKPKTPKQNYKWVLKHTYRNTKEVTFFDKIVKMIILVSLKLTLNKRILTNSIKKREFINTTYENMSSPKFNFIPAGLGLYLFFSMIPVSIIVISTISAISKIPSLTGGNDLGWDIILRHDILTKIIPGVDSLLIVIDTDDVNNIFFNTTIILLLLSSIWFSSKGLSKFIDSQSAIYDHIDQTNFIIKRLRGIMMVPIISIFFIISLLSLIPLLALYQKYWPPISPTERIFGWEYETLFYFTMLIYLTVWSYIGVGLLFRFSPLFKLKWNEISPGIVITIIPTIIFIMSFGYISSLIDYTKYGAIGTFLYSITFVLVLSYFLYAGILINASYYKTFFSQRIVPKKWFLTNRFLEKLDFFKRRR